MLSTLTFWAAAASDLFWNDNLRILGIQKQRKPPTIGRISTYLANKYRIYIQYSRYIQLSNLSILDTSKFHNYACIFVRVPLFHPFSWMICSQAPNRPQNHRELSWKGVALLDVFLNTILSFKSKNGHLFGVRECWPFFVLKKNKCWVHAQRQVQLLQSAKKKQDHFFLSEY